MFKKLSTIIVLLIILVNPLPFVEAETGSDFFPKWVEKNIDWWHEKKLSESEFVLGINWLIENKIILIPTKVPDYKAGNEKFEIQKDIEKNFAPKIIERCGNDSNCAVEELYNLSKKENQNTIMITYYSLLDYFKKTETFCHRIAHHFGKFILEYSQNVTLALLSNDPVLCGGSIYHSIVATYMISQVTTHKRDPIDINIHQICPQDQENEPTITRWECLHGIGHGLTKSYEFDVFSAIKRCDEFKNGWERVSCSKGLFMENVVNYYKGGAATIDSSDLFFPCNKLEDRFVPPCYHYHARHILFQKNSNFDGAFLDCMKVPDEFAKYCYRGLGNQLTPYVLVDINYSLKCQNNKPIYQANCFQGIAMVLADNRSIDEALDFCEVVPPEFKVDCYAEVGKWIRMVYSTNEQRFEACLKSKNSEYIVACMKGNFEGIKIL